MPIYKDKASGRWMFDFDRRIEGTRVRRRQLLPEGFTRTQADAFDRKESAALYAIATGVAKPRHHIDEAVARYLKERVPNLKSGTNIERELGAMYDWYAGRFVDELHAVCDAYAEDQHGALKPATVKNRIAYLRAACRWAWKKHGLAESDPGARVSAPPVSNARDVTVTRAQMVRLARACRHRGVRALIRIAYWSGMRVSEIQRAERIGGAFVLRDSKNQTPRIIPINRMIAAASRVAMPRRSEIDYYWPLARKACAMSHVRLHDLRHTAASEMVSAGEDLGTVGAVLGHKSAQTTKRYAHYATARLADALGKIGRKLA